jgi:hypothetical protein
MPMKKIYYWLIAILLLLIITNPSSKSFKDFIGCSECAGLTKPYNFFVCSIYEYKYHGEYFGILDNFILTEKYPPFQLLPK